MPSPDRFLRGPDGLEQAIQLWMQGSDKPLRAESPEPPYRGLFKDLVVFFHERTPAPTGAFPPHAGILLDLQQALHADLERHVTVGDLPTSVTAALAVLRVLYPLKPEKVEIGAGGIPSPTPRGNPRLGFAAGAAQRPLGKAGSTWHLDSSALRAIRDKVAKTVQASALVDTTGLARILPPSRRTQPFDRIPFMDELMQVLEDDPELLRVLRLLGRLSDADSLRRTMGAQPPSGELCDVTRGAELARILPSEWALLASPGTRWEFYRRFTERGLLQYEQLPRSDDRGTICICIDRSSSMMGPKSALARAIALFVCKQALAQRRDTCVLFFDTEVEVFEIPWQAASPERILGILRARMGEENNYTTALRACVRQAKAKRFRSADILLIGDAEEDPTGREIRWYGAFGKWMERTGTKLVTIHLGSAQGKLHEILRGLSCEFLEIEDVENPITERICSVIDEIT